MKRWLLMLGGLLVWAVHFFAVYAAASIFPGAPTANVVALVVTVMALAAGGALLWWTVRFGRTTSDAFDQWTWRVGATAAAFSILAVLWQGLPALSFPR